MKKKLALLTLTLLGIVAIVGGTTYAFFSFTRSGSTENTITSGDIVFHYDEISGKGRGINLIDALPVDSDNDAKESNDYFDFKVTSNSNIAQIPYTISAKLSDDSDLDNTIVKVYLTKVVGATETQILYTTLDQLEERTFLNNDVQKVLYRDTVSVNGQSYEVNYRLRMWIAEGTDFTSGTYNNKKVLLTVNVYTNEGQLLTKEEHYTKSDDTSIKMISANNTYLLTESSDTDVNYEVNVPNEINTADFDIIEKNIAASSTVTELGPTLSYNDKGIIKRLSKSSTFTLLSGDNYFKVTTTAADGETSKDYILNVYREYNKDNNLTSLSVDGYAFTETFDEDTLTYHVSNAVEASSITISGNKSADVAQIEGTGTKTLAWGENTFTVTVTPEDPNTQPKVYTIIVNNQRPTAPVITGGTTGNKVLMNTKISMTEPGTAISGVSGYEYYTTQSSTVPSDSTQGTALAYPYEVKVENQGSTYVYYRTVSTNGNKSSWTSAQKINITPGLYDDNGNTIKTWAQLESLGLTKTSIETTYTSSNYKTAAGSPYKVFTDNSLTGNIVLPNTITKVGQYSFRDVSITGLIVSNSVTFIDQDAFKNTVVKTVIIPSSVTTMGTGVFSRCANLATVMLSDNMTSIPAWTFEMDTALTSINIPNSLTEVGRNAFDSCTNIQFNVYDNGNYIGSSTNPYYYLAGPVSTTASSITIHPDTKIIGANAFYYNKTLTSISIPNNVISISPLAFSGCSNLRTIALSNNLKDIGENAFSGVPITSITIPASVIKIGNEAFFGCSSLTSVTISNGVTNVGRYAFFRSGLTSVTIPASVTSIGNYAFGSCPNLTTVTFADTSKQWMLLSDSTATSGTNISITNPTTNATNLRYTSSESPSGYANYFWKRK